MPNSHALGSHRFSNSEKCPKRKITNKWNRIQRNIFLNFPELASQINIRVIRRVEFKVLVKYDPLNFLCHVLRTVTINFYILSQSSINVLARTRRTIVSTVTCSYSERFLSTFYLTFLSHNKSNRFITFPSD